ncbi:MAG: ATP-binding protein, partial [Pseudomonadales bacterium]|nr:ATP-binding protein [Pseudomonadales bacterium]
FARVLLRVYGAQSLSQLRTQPVLILDEPEASDHDEDEADKDEHWWPFAESDSDEEAHEYSKLGHKYEKKLAFQIWDHENRLISQTQSAEREVLPRQTKGFNTVEGDENGWRTFTLYDAERMLWVQVAQREDVRSELTNNIAGHALIPQLILVPVLALLIWWLVGLAVQPLNLLSRQLKSRDITRSDPISDVAVPSEVMPLLAELNALFARVQAFAQREKRFTADAAHELRTPLAAVKIQLQNADRRCTDDRVSSPIQKALAAVERMIRLVEQLLELSRLDNRNILEKTVDTDVAVLLADVLDDVEQVAAMKGVRIIEHQRGAGILRVNPLLMMSLFRNLLDNAIRYTPEGGQVDVTLSDQSLIIEDHGPGIPEPMRDRVIERFFRQEGDASEGSGLGLAICNEIAGFYDISMHLLSREDGATGLRVQLDFTPRKS